MSRLSQSFLIACLLIVPLGCNSSSPSAPEMNQLAIEPSNVALASGQSVQFSVMGEGAGAGVSWSSSNTAVAAVDASGMVTTRFMAGSALITARTAEAEGRGEVTVLRGCASPVVIEGDPGSGSTAAAQFDVRFGPGQDAAALTSDFAALYGFRTLETFPDGFRAELTPAQINSIVCRTEVASVAFV